MFERAGGPLEIYGIPRVTQTHIPAMFAQGGPPWSVGQMHLAAFLPKANLYLCSVSKQHPHARKGHKNLQKKNRALLIKPN